MKFRILFMILIFSCTYPFPVFAIEGASKVALVKDSLYQVQTPWKNQDGQEIKLQDFLGQPVVMSMAYTSCQYSCPLTLAKLAEIEKDFLKKGLKKYQFVVASFDPENDTPAVLKAYMMKKKINSDHWSFITAKSSQDVRQLAVLLGINYEKQADGDFSHSNGVILLDSKGRMALQLKGLSADHQSLVEKAALYEGEK